MALECSQHNSGVTQNEIGASSKLNWSEARDERSGKGREGVSTDVTLPSPSSVLRNHTWQPSSRRSGNGSLGQHLSSLFPETHIEFISTPDSGQLTQQTVPGCQLKWTSSVQALRPKELDLAGSAHREMLLKAFACI